MSDSDYEPDQEEETRYSRRARKQARYNDSMFFDSDEGSDDDWKDPSFLGPRDRQIVTPEPEYSSDSDDLTVKDDKIRVEEMTTSKVQVIPLETASIFSAWSQFITFSQFIPNNKELDVEGVDKMFQIPWNPYQADLMKVSVYLKLLQNRCKYGVKKMAVHLDALRQYIGVLPDSLDDIVKSCKIDLAKVPKRLTRRMDTYKISHVVGSVWYDFSIFCYHIADVDPFLAQPQHLANFMVGKLIARDRQLSKDYQNLKPYQKFFTENIMSISKGLKGNLKIFHMNGDDGLMDSEPLKRLLEVSEDLENLVSPRDEELGYRLSSSYWYTVYMSREHSKSFWSHSLVRKVVRDVSKGLLSTVDGAWQFGLPSNMISSAVSKASKDQEVDFTLSQYLEMGFGTEDQFWTEDSTVGLLEDVRIRREDFDNVAFKLGIAGRKLMEKVGAIKSEEELKQDKVDEKKTKRDKTKVKLLKKPSLLEKQIAVSEENEENLSDYEKVRLQNMRERQQLMEMLNFKEDIVDLNEMKNRTNTPIDYGVREKSSRIKRKAEESEKEQKNAKSSSRATRHSPDWVGMWTPVYSLSERTKMGEEDINNLLPLPRLNFKLNEVLSSGESYHKTARFMERLGDEIRDVSEVEKRTSTPVWGSFSKLENSSRLSEEEILSLDTWEDLTAFGDISGNVGIRLGGRNLSLRPHNQPVTRVRFISDGGGGLEVVSGSLDGTIRVTDLVTQTVSLETSFADYSGEVRWVDVTEPDSWLVNLSGEVRQIDRRQNKSQSVLKFKQKDWEGTNIGRHPVNSNLLSVCSDSCVTVWDIRHTDRMVTHFIHSDGRDEGLGFVGGNWSCGSGKYMLGCEVVESGTSGYHVPTVWDYTEGSIVRQVEVTSEITGYNYSRFFGSAWCPWSEDVFLTTTTFGRTGTGNIYRSVMAVEASSGEVMTASPSEISQSFYLVECHRTKHQILVANSAESGYLTTYQYINNDGDHSTDEPEEDDSGGDGNNSTDESEEDDSEGDQEEE